MLFPNIPKQLITIKNKPLQPNKTLILTHFLTINKTHSDLIKRCWHTNPSKRPVFDDITFKFVDIVAFSLIACESGQQFWLQMADSTDEEHHTSILDKFLGRDLLLRLRCS